MGVYKSVSSDLHSRNEKFSSLCESGTDEEIVYPMHPACWQIFLQAHALLAPRNPLSPDLEILGHIFAISELEEKGRGLVPDWAGDYAGPEQFWDDGWTWSEDIDASIVAGLLEEKPEWDYLVSDPEISIDLAQLMQHPPMIPSNILSLNHIHSNVDVEDGFSQLPEELLLDIMCFLPTASVQNVRLASKIIASVPLGPSFWRSRFAYPNELCHVRLPAGFPRDCQSNTLSVDWREMCYRLLHLDDSRQPDSWKNRKRIVSLNSKLVQRMLSEGSSQGRSDPLSHLACHHLFSCRPQRVANASSGRIPTSTPFTISSTFRLGRPGPFLSGLAFTGPETRLELGFHDPLNAEFAIIRESEHLMGFVLAMTAEGIVGIQALIRTEDGKIREESSGRLGPNVSKGLLCPASGGPVQGLTVSLLKVCQIYIVFTQMIWLTQS